MQITKIKYEIKLIPPNGHHKINNEYEILNNI